MDDATGAGTATGNPDDRSDVLRLLNSDDWQKRLEEARRAREKVLSARTGKSALAGNVTRLDRAAPVRPEPHVLADLEELPDWDELLDPDPAPSAPFERDGVADASSLQPSALERIVPLRVALQRPMPIEPQVYLEPQVAPTPAPAPALAPNPAPAAPPRSLALRLLTGFAIGVSVGAGLASVLWLRDMMSLPQDQAAATGQAIVSTPIAPETPAPLPPIVIASAPDPAVVPVVPATAAAPPLQSAIAPVAALLVPVGLGTPAADPDPVDLGGSGRLSGPIATLRPPLLVAVAAPIGRFDDTMALPSAQPAVGLAEAPALARSTPEDVALPRPEMLTVAPNSAPPGLSASLETDATPDASAAPPAPPIAPLQSRIPLRSPLVLQEEAAKRAVYAGTQVKLLAPANLDDDAIGTTVTALRVDGFAVADPSRVSVTISADHVRYYHPGDAAAAEVLAARIGGEARDFIGASDQAPEGTIELWLRGGAPKAKVAQKNAGAAKKAARKAPAPQVKQEDPQVRSLRERLVKQLKDVNKS